MYHLGLQDETEKGYVQVPFTIHQCRELCCSFLTIFCVSRAAEDLLSQIQENYRKPQEELAVLKEAVSSLLLTHNSDVRAAEELLREAETKIQESGRLLLLIGANLREFNVSPASSRPLRAGPKCSPVNDVILYSLKKWAPRADFIQHTGSGTRGSEASLLFWSILRGDVCCRRRSCVFRKNRAWHQRWSLKEEDCWMQPLLLQMHWERLSWWVPTQHSPGFPGKPPRPQTCC